MTTHSAYDNICSEHLRLLGDLAKLTRLFRSIPVQDESNVYPSAHPAGLPHPPDAAGGALTAAIASVATAAATPRPAAGVNWPERDLLKQEFGQFQTALARHFEHESDILFPAILMAMPTRAMCAWVFKLVQEHGAMEHALQNLSTLLDNVCAPLPHFWFSELDRQFEKVRVILLGHAADEDSKFVTLLKNNPEITAQIKKLLQARPRTIPPGKPRSVVYKEF